jgi:hypothetical protein
MSSAINAFAVNSGLKTHAEKALKRRVLKFMKISRIEQRYVLHILGSPSGTSPRLLPYNTMQIPSPHGPFSSVKILYLKVSIGF